MYIYIHIYKRMCTVLVTLKISLSLKFIFSTHHDLFHEINESNETKLCQFDFALFCYNENKYICIYVHTLK